MEFTPAGAADHGRRLDTDQLRPFDVTEDASAGSGIGIRTSPAGSATPTPASYAQFLEVADRQAATALGGVMAALAPATGSHRSAPEAGDR